MPKSTTILIVCVCIDCHDIAFLCVIYFAFLILPEIWKYALVLTLVFLDKGKKKTGSRHSLIYNYKIELLNSLIHLFSVGLESLKGKLRLKGLDSSYISHKVLFLWNNIVFIVAVA